MWSRRGWCPGQCPPRATRPPLPPTPVQPMWDLLTQLALRSHADLAVQAEQYRGPAPDNPSGTYGAPPCCRVLPRAPPAPPPPPHPPHPTHTPVLLTPCRCALPFHPDLPPVPAARTCRLYLPPAPVHRPSCTYALATPLPQRPRDPPACSAAPAGRMRAAQQPPAGVTPGRAPLSGPAPAPRPHRLQSTLACSWRSRRLLPSGPWKYGCPGCPWPSHPTSPPRTSTPCTTWSAPSTGAATRGSACSRRSW